MFFDPQAHTSRGVPFDTVVTGYRQAIVKAERELGMSASLILCFLRDMSADFAMATLMEALPYKDWIIAVGLDSDERDNPPSKFADVFARARAEGFLLTSHCDIDQAGSIEHIRQVIEDIGVDRIDHGTNIVEDPALVAAVRERGIGFTCCPVSNDFVVDDMKATEIVQLLRDGVRVTGQLGRPGLLRRLHHRQLPGPGPGRRPLRRRGRAAGPQRLQHRLALDHPARPVPGRARRVHGGPASPE